MPPKRFTEAELTIVRRAYARQMLAIAGAEGAQRLEAAFASVRRERFLGPLPWRISQGLGHRELPSDDPVALYQDILLALAAERGVNNGSPSLHARWLHAAGLKPADRVAHLGAGTGYYTAIIAELVGARGRVMAVEIDARLAAMAMANLSDRPNVVVTAGDAMTEAAGPFDCVYVNFAVERPVKQWTDCLAPGGRLIFPLGVAEPSKGRKGARYSSQGAGFLVERKPQGISVRWLGRAYFVCAEGAAVASRAEREALQASFAKGGVEFVRSLHWNEGGTPERNWCVGRGWRLCYDEIGA